MRHPIPAILASLLLGFTAGCNLGSVETEGATADKSSSQVVSKADASKPATQAKAAGTQATAKASASTAAQPAAATAANPTSLFVTTPNSLTLRSDFAAAVGQVKVLVRINDPHRPGSVGGAASTQVIPTRSGNTWTLPQPLASYPSGNVPNTWAYQVAGRLPAGVTYHIDLGYGFIRSGDNPFGPGNRTYPPTTR